MQLLRLKEAAKVIDTSEHTLRRAIHNGELRWINVATGDGARPRVRVDMDDLRAWLETRASKPRTAA